MARYSIEIFDKIIDPPFTILKYDVSEEEFFQFATEDLSCELIDGVLIIHSPASLQHENIFRFLITLLTLFLDKTNYGKVIGSRYAMRLGTNYIFEPDIMVVLKDSLSQLKPTYLDGPADFIIEILSPTTRKADISQKIPLYLKKNVKEIWVIDPDNQELIVHTPEKKEKFSENNILHSNVIKDFWLELNWIWENESYKPLDCYNVIIKDFT